MSLCILVFVYVVKSTGKLLPSKLFPAFTNVAVLTLLVEFFAFLRQLSWENPRPHLVQILDLLRHLLSCKWQEWVHFTSRPLLKSLKVVFVLWMCSDFQRLSKTVRVRGINYWGSSRQSIILQCWDNTAPYNDLPFKQIERQHFV